MSFELKFNFVQGKLLGSKIQNSEKLNHKICLHGSFIYKDILRVLLAEIWRLRSMVENFSLFFFGLDF